jgi:hypothetical protein
MIKMNYIFFSVTDRMVEAGALVMICDKMIPSDRTSLPPNIEFVECDVRDKVSISPTFYARLFSCESFERSFFVLTF